MKYKVLKSLTGLIVSVLWTVSCGPEYTIKTIRVNPPFDASFIKKIAVVEFSNYTNKRHAGKVIADHIEQLLVAQSGYQVISRMELNQILREQRLGTSGVLTPSAARIIGKLAGVDAVVVGQVQRFEIVSKSWITHFGSYSSTTYKKTATVVFTFKVLNTITGQVVWAKTAHGDYWREAGEQKIDYLNRESDYEYLQNAIQHAMWDVKFLFPHNRRVRIRKK